MHFMENHCNSKSIFVIVTRPHRSCIPWPLRPTFLGPHPCLRRKMHQWRTTTSPWSRLLLRWCLFLHPCFLPRRWSSRCLYLSQSYVSFLLVLLFWRPLPRLWLWRLLHQLFHWLGDWFPALLWTMLPHLGGSIRRGGTVWGLSSCSLVQTFNFLDGGSSFWVHSFSICPVYWQGEVLRLLKAILLTSGSTFCRLLGVSTHLARVESQTNLESIVVSGALYI